MMPFKPLLLFQDHSDRESLKSLAYSQIMIKLQCKFCIYSECTIQCLHSEHFMGFFHFGSFRECLIYIDTDIN